MYYVGLNIFYVLQTASYNLSEMIYKVKHYIIVATFLLLKNVVILGIDKLKWYLCGRLKGRKLFI